jgi:hypothetical protein
MFITTKTFRIALAAAALCSAASAADAKPRRLVILDFDGPRGLADTGRTAVVNLLGEQYDVVATKRWEDARAAAQQKSHGPSTWQKAAKQSGVDAVIEGWIQDEGRHKVLTVAVREAATGVEIDSVSVKLGAKGLSADGKTKLQTDLDGVLEYIEGTPDPTGSRIPTIDRKWIGAKDPVQETTKRTRDASDEDGDETEPAKPIKKKRIVEATDEAADPAPRKSKKVAPELDEAADPAPRKIKKAAAEPAETEGDASDETVLRPKREKEVALAPEEKERNDLLQLFGPSPESIIVEKRLAHTPVPTPRFQIGGGAYYGSRSLTFGAENQTGPQAYAGVPSKGLELDAAVYPFPLEKVDGGLSGVGFSFQIAKSAASVVTFDDLETVADYTIDQTSWKGAIHYRTPLSDLVTIDGEVNYGRSTYIIQDAPQTFEVPDTDYQYMGAGAHLDLNITERASVGFGGRYMYLLDTGDISSVDWYGPGRAGGYEFDASFVIPLPNRLYVRGEISYQHIGIELDGVGQITEDEGVYETNDATVNGAVNLGITF